MAFMEVFTLLWQASKKENGRLCEVGEADVCEVGEFFYLVVGGVVLGTSRKGRDITTEIS